jgi:hypothetical protein
MTGQHMINNEIETPPEERGLAIACLAPETKLNRIIVVELELPNPCVPVSAAAAQHLPAGQYNATSASGRWIVPASASGRWIAPASASGRWIMPASERRTSRARRWVSRLFALERLRSAEDAPVSCVANGSAIFLGRVTARQ